MAGRLTDSSRLNLVVALAASLALFGCDDEGGDGNTGGGGTGGGGSTSQCDTTPPDCSQYTGPATIEVGIGQKLTGFATVVDGSEKTVELGPQGLYMFQLAINATGLYPGKAGRVAGCTDDPLVQTQIMLDGDLVGGTGANGDEGGLFAGFTKIGDTYELSGIFTPFATFAEFSSLYVGKTVTLAASIKDGCNNSASDEVTVVVAQ